MQPEQINMKEVKRVLFEIDQFIEKVAAKYGVTLEDCAKRMFIIEHRHSGVNHIAIDGRKVAEIKYPMIGDYTYTMHELSENEQEPVSGYIMKEMDNAARAKNSSEL